MLAIFTAVGIVEPVFKIFVWLTVLPLLFCTEDDEVVIGLRGRGKLVIVEIKKKGKQQES